MIKYLTMTVISALWQTDFENFLVGNKGNINAENCNKAFYFIHFSTPSISLGKKNEQLYGRNLFPRDTYFHETFGISCQPKGPERKQQLSGGTYLHAHLNSKGVLFRKQLCSLVLSNANPEGLLAPINGSFGFCFFLQEVFPSAFRHFVASAFLSPIN